MILERDKPPAEPYRHQDYPGHRYRVNGEVHEFTVVNDADADAELGPEWSKTPHPPQIVGADGVLKTLHQVHIRPHLIKPLPVKLNEPRLGDVPVITPPAGKRAQPAK